MATTETVGPRANRIDLKDCKTVGEIVEKAGLNYKMKKIPAKYVDLDGRIRPIPAASRWAFQIVREDTGDYIANVGAKYTIMQTSDYLAQLVEPMKAGVLRPVSAVSVDNGRALTIEAQLPNPIKVKGPGGKEDVIFRRILYSNTFDGTRPMTLSDAILRQWCTNGATAVMGMESHTLRHTASAEQNVAIFLKAVDESLKRFQRVEHNVKRLVEARFSSKQMEEVAAKLFPAEVDPETKEIPSRTRTSRDELNKLFVAGQGTAGRTAWDAVNAVTEYDSHHRTVRAPNPELARMLATWSHTPGDRVTAAIDTVLQISGVATA